MSEKLNHFITGLDQLISESEVIRNKVDFFDLVPLGIEGQGRLLMVEMARQDISSKDVVKSKLSRVPKRLLISTLVNNGGFHLQACQMKPSSGEPAHGYLELSALTNRCGFEAMFGYNLDDPLRVETTLARSFNGKINEAVLATAVFELLRTRPNEVQEDDALALLALANDILNKLAPG